MSWLDFGQAVERYWTAATFGDWQIAALCARDAAHSCPVREEVPLWLERERDAHQRTLSPVRQFFGWLLVRRSG